MINFKLMLFGFFLALFLFGILVSYSYSLHSDNIAKKGILNIEYLLLDKYILIGTKKTFFLGEAYIYDRYYREEDQIIVLKCSVLDTLFLKCKK